MENVIIETVVSIVSTLVVTLIGILGAWLMSKIGKTAELKSIAAAVEEATGAAQTTVLELQQTVVEDLKAKSADGKLTKHEIEDLGRKLLKGAYDKMSASCINTLNAAGVDLNALITGAGEALIAEIKGEERGKHEA